MLAHSAPIGTSSGSYEAILVIAGGTLVGAWLNRRSRHRAVVFGCAAGVLLAVAAIHLLPGAIAASRHGGPPWWALLALATGAYAALAPVLRTGCPCEATPAGPGAALAISTHRANEGSVLALSGSLVIVVALAVHAAGEGMALAAVLGTDRRRRAAAWLTLAGVSPALGALAVGVAPLPAAAIPVLLAICAGVLLRIAWGAARFAAHDERFGRSVVAAGAAAYAITTATVLVG